MNREQQPPLSTFNKIGSTVSILALIIFFGWMVSAWAEDNARVKASATPTPAPKIQQLISEKIPFDTPIEFYTEDGGIKWRQVLEGR